MYFGHFEIEHHPKAQGQIAMIWDDLVRLPDMQDPEQEKKQFVLTAILQLIVNEAGRRGMPDKEIDKICANPLKRGEIPF